MRMNELLTERNNIKIWGKGTQPVFFIHGYGCDQQMWRFITPAFEQTHKIVLIDLVGSGQSDTNAYDYEKYASLEGYAHDIVEICETFALENTILVGHSVSAMIAGLAAAMQPALFAKLVMVCPSPHYINEGEYKGGFSQSDIDDMIQTLNSNYLGWTSAITPVIMGNPDKPEHTQELAGSFCRNNPAIAKHFAQVTFNGDHRHNLKRIATPTLIIQCTDDVLAPREVGEFVHGQIENSTLEILKATGHCPHLTAPAETLDALMRFI